MRHLKSAGAAFLSILVLGAAAGCGPNLKAPDGTRVSLRDYDAVVVEPITMDPSINLPGLPEQLRTAILGSLRTSVFWRVPAENWAVPGLPLQASNPSPGRPVRLRVRVKKVVFPSKGESVLLGTDHCMTCQVEVHDPHTNTLLGDAEVTATHDAGGPGLLGGGVVGVLINLSAYIDGMEDQLLIHQMAEEIVKVLERARKYSPPPAKKPPAPSQTKNPPPPEEPQAQTAPAPGEPEKPPPPR